MASAGVGGSVRLARVAGPVGAALEGAVRRVPSWLREFLLVAALYGLYELVRGSHHSAPAIALRNSRDILHWEQGLHLDPESWLTHTLVHLTALAVPCAYFYSTMHYLITPIVLVWMYRCHRGEYRTARTALAFGTMTGLIVFWLVPCAPPRLLRAAHVPDALFDLRHYGWWGGDGSVPRGLGGLTNQLAAMPSLHVGWALWCGFLIARYCRFTAVRVLGVAYPLVTVFVVLSTGNHYLLDVLAGVAVIVFGTGCAFASRWAVRRIAASRLSRAAARADGPGAGSPDAPRDENAAGYDPGLVTTSRVA